MTYSQYSIFSYPKNLLSVIQGEEYEEDITDDILAGTEYGLSTLTERERYILESRFKELKTYGEIAEVIGVTEHCVDSLIKKTVLKIKRSCWHHMLYGLQGGKEIMRNSLDISTMGFGARTFRSLKRAGIKTLNEIGSYADFAVIRGIGPKSIDEIVKKMQEIGLNLKQ